MEPKKDITFHVIILILKNSIFILFSCCHTNIKCATNIFFFKFVCCHCVRDIYIFVSTLSKNGFSSSMPVQELAEVDILRAYHTSCFFVVAVVVSFSRERAAQN